MESEVTAEEARRTLRGIINRKAAFLPTFLLGLALLSCGISARPVRPTSLHPRRLQFKSKRSMAPRQGHDISAVTIRQPHCNLRNSPSIEEPRPLRAVNLTNLGILTFRQTSPCGTVRKSVGLPLQQLTQRLNRVRMNYARSRSRMHPPGPSVKTLLLHTTRQVRAQRNQCEGCALNPSTLGPRRGRHNNGNTRIVVSCWHNCATSYDHPDAVWRPSRATGEL
ncbi:hypothetical protein BV898_19837 [Hypsibius exemplaris]|uniref:Uncharacterized protein n=1 Tax=Hypsibius exemplaris TaxID=2072580 RepID=A0A9X6NJY6_HYPEX|nr:hypothetical protein BV898_19837 [Hypsibius exemplaris]